MSDKKDTGERLEKLVGFDAAKHPSITNEVFKEVLADLHKERAEKAKAQATEQIRKALELREKMVKAEREFNKQKQKFDQELGKLLNRLEAQLNGSGGAEEQEETPPRE